MEEWRTIKGYEGLYEVSSLGRVRRMLDNGKCRLRKLVETDKGYLSVVLSKKGVTKGFFVHKLVAFAFPEICGEWFEGATINHKNEDKKDNNPENLEFLSMVDNIRYGTGIARRGITQGLNRRKPICTINKKTGEVIGEYDSITDCSKDTGINTSSISMVLHNKYGHKSAGGLQFRFV